MLTCWLCHNLCHYKCTGLPTLVNEAVTQYDGVNYFCVSCRKPAVEFFRFFQGTKTRFLEIKKTVSVLADNISNYGKLFEESTALDNLKSPPELSPKRRKSARKNGKDKEKLPLGTLPLEPNSNDNVLTTPMTTTQPENLQIATTPVNQDPVGASARQTTYDSTTGAAASDNFTYLDLPSSSNNLQPIDVNNRTPFLNGRSPFNSNVNGIITGIKLKVIPPKKSIFISRFAFETSAEDITHYILNKINADCADIFTKKFNYSQPRNITSFKITVSPDLFDQILDPYFWPENTLVREYVYRDNARSNNIVRLPMNTENRPKN